MPVDDSSRTAVRIVLLLLRLDPPAGLLPFDLLAGIRIEPGHTAADCLEALIGRCARIFEGARRPFAGTGEQVVLC